MKIVNLMIDTDSDKGIKLVDQFKNFLPNILSEVIGEFLAGSTAVTDLKERIYLKIIFGNKAV